MVMRNLCDVKPRAGVRKHNAQLGFVPCCHQFPLGLWGVRNGIGVGCSMAASIVAAISMGIATVLLVDSGMTTRVSSPTWVLRFG